MPDSEEELLNGHNPTGTEDVFYENVITHGIIKSITTSDTGSGEIMYELRDVKPPCPESNPYVLEKNIITIFI